jgi:hypothetical protein
MKPFKFFSENEDEEPSLVDIEIDGWDGASWMYGRVENLDQYQYDILIDNHYGIRSFLNEFPPGFIVTILSITGPDGRIHDIDNCNNGWGFDILSDLIRIEWVRFRN